MKKVFIYVLAIIAVAAVVLILVRNKKAKEEKLTRKDILSAIPVTVAEVKMEKLSIPMTYLGTTYPYNEVNIASEVTGKVVGVYFNIGDKVSKGKTLVRLDAETKTATLMTAEINFEKAEKDLERYEELYKQNSITEVQLETARQLYKQAESQLIIARKQVADTRIIAPFAGIITNKSVELGAVVSPGISLGTLINISSLKVRINVPENEVFRLRVGLPATVASEVYPNKQFEAKIININSKGDDAHTFQVELLMKNSVSFPLKAGIFVKVHFESVSDFETLVVPRNALLGSIKEPQVYVVQENIVLLKNIKVGITVADKVEVKEGLNLNDQVVVSGQLNLKDSAVVSIVK
ncbi:MAG: efflux RND transporter periplasmic adaptor subunit [Ignavibacteria bacterium]